MPTFAPVDEQLTYLKKGAAEIIRDGINGYLFAEDGEIADCVAHALELRRQAYQALLPADCRGVPNPVGSTLPSAT